ncbi:hypothetical protein NQ317_017990 [Molorchus minor]|uniref:Uncharacterized protein n=1 Tax=Molorchus minor TaxID=1323400 RepID=A0ABQ9J5M3_9CUCU|nr:hypothetical protein NQ317_017990 [Molorchus minor]
METRDIVVEELDESQKINSVNRLYGDKENQFRVNIVIDDRVHNVQIDSGVSISACSELTYKQYFHDYPLRNDNIVLRGYDGKNLKILGQFQCRVLYKTQTHTKFIQNISTLLKPIYNLLKKDQNFRWTQECNQAFKK